MLSSKALRSDLLLFFTAMIWGLAFVAQRKGAEFVGAFTFNGARFLLGALVVFLFLILRKANRIPQDVKMFSLKQQIFAGIIIGSVLCIGATFQQIGMESTTAGKGGFITGLYIIFAPLLSILLKKKQGVLFWMGVVLATLGLYYLSMDKGNFAMSKGDLFVLISAVFWALQIIMIGEITQKVDSFVFSFVQFLTCGLISIVLALFFEQIMTSSLMQAAIPILYSGIFSVGIAFTIQVVAQKHSPASHSAVIMSFEAVFAALGGWIILNEGLTKRAILGCCLMMAGMILAQVHREKKKELNQV